MLPAVRRVLDSAFVQTLATPHGVDRYLEVLNPTWSVHEVKARVIAASRPTADSVTLTLKPNGNWQGFIPGQFVRLSLEIDGVRRTRCYSPANSTHAPDGCIELTAKAHQGGFVSKFLLDRAEAGMVLGLSQADGAFRLPAQRPGRVLLISGGSGITPVMSMLRTLADEGYAGRITFLHYCNTAQDQIYAQELRGIAARHANVQLLRCYTANPEGGDLVGLFSGAQLASVVPDFREAETFLCGPPGLMKLVEEVYAQEGISDRLHLERFGAAPARATTATAAQGEVRFAAATSASLLDQAEAAGLKPESGCRIGICHTCSCKKLSGRVRDLRTGAISGNDEEEIQICITAPVDTVTLDL